MVLKRIRVLTESSTFFKIFKPESSIVEIKDDGRYSGFVILTDKNNKKIILESSWSVKNGLLTSLSNLKTETRNPVYIGVVESSIEKNSREWSFLSKFSHLYSTRML